MVWLKKAPWISGFLLLLTYGVFGWIYSKWVIVEIDHGRLLNALENNTETNTLFGLGIFWILLIAAAITAPIALMGISMTYSLKTEGRIFVSILLGTLAFSIIIQSLDYFTRFLVLVSAAMLMKLDLQLLGCKKWTSSAIVAIFCLLGFGGGILAFYTWGLQSYE
jgi:uncharacterized protein YacL